MSFVEFAQHRFDIVSLIALNTILLGLITAFSAFEWNPVVLDNLLQWEFGALTALVALLQAGRTGSRRSDNGGKEKGEHRETV